jgi:hypothetical protein
MIRRDFPDNMSYLSNGRIKIGVNLAVGGAITFLSDLTLGEDNIINSFDLGRQVQMSYYSGPVPYKVAGNAGPKPVWEQIGWNPIQTGDDFGNFSKVIDFRNDGKSIYLKCVPMQWPLDNVPGECVFESWIHLEESAARIRARIVMDRRDQEQWPARGQELPAVYSNGPWYNLWTYSGDDPFAHGPLTQIEHPFTWSAPWAHFAATERWAALIDRHGRGVGVWSPSTTNFSGGFYGAKGIGGPKDEATGYIAPSRNEILDHNVVHEYNYALICGDINSIRSWVYEQPRRTGLPVWDFKSDRQGWTYANARDSGWPIQDGLTIFTRGQQEQPQIISPPDAWKATEGPMVTLTAKVGRGISAFKIHWKPSGAAAFLSDDAALLKVKDRNGFQRISVDLSEFESYKGLISQIRIDPIFNGESARMTIKSVKVHS